VAYNPKKTLKRKLERNVYNPFIPSMKKQGMNMDGFLNDISERKNIILKHNNDVALTRNYRQTLIASSTDGRVIVGFKPFHDSKYIYDRIPLKKAPICPVENMVFSLDGTVWPCCIDYKNKTTIGSLVDNSFGEILEKYEKTINIMRTTGTPWESCKSCMGYSNNLHKYAKTIIGPLHIIVTNIT